MSLKKLPSYPTCFVCGQRTKIGLHLQFLYDDENEEVVCDINPRDWWEGYVGIIHGGIQAAIMDDGMGWAIYPATGDYYLTMELKIRYKRPLKSDDKCKFRGRITKRLGDYFVTEGELVDEQGKVYAKATGKYKRIPSS